MEPNTILFIIILILFFDYLLNSVLSFLNYKSLSEPVPKELSSIYKESDYQKSQDYNISEIEKLGHYFLLNLKDFKQKKFLTFLANYLDNYKEIK